MCDSCLAQDGKYVTDQMNYRNLGTEAAWPLTMLDHDTYLQMDHDCISPWAAVGGWRLDNTSWDLMHNLFLGTGRDLVASAIRCMIDRNVFGHGELDNILDDVHKEMHATCSSHGCLG